MDDPRCVNLVHVCADGDSVVADAHFALAKAGRLCDGVQLNTPWPSRSDVVRATKWACKRVVLQVRDYLDYDNATHAGEPARIRVARAIGEYAGVITDVLLDASCGRGVALHPASLREAIATIRVFNPWCGIGVAGNLSSDTLPLIADLRTEFPWLSIDAESGLRDASDHLDIGKMKAYLEAAA